MSLARVQNPLRPLLIRRLGDAGGPRGDDVEAELDNIIAFIKQGVRCIHRDTSTVGNVGGGLDTLHTFSLPAGTLATNGDYIRTIYSGTIANNDNDKNIVTEFDTSILHSYGNFDFDGAPGNDVWSIAQEIMRVSATQVRTTSRVMIANIIADGTGAFVNTNGGHIGRNGTFTVANLDSNAITVRVRAESAGAASNDIVQNFSIIELSQQ